MQSWRDRLNSEMWHRVYIFKITFLLYTATKNYCT